jgi:mutator protein MutT
MWEFPGGKKEAEESLEECLERELREELGVKVSVGNHCLTVEHSYDDRYITLHVFHCILLDGDPRPLQSDAIVWVTPAELGRYEFPPPDREIIEYLRRRDPERKEDQMFYKKDSDGYRSLAEGIQMKSLTHGEKTLLCEFRIAGGASLPSHAHPHEQTGYLVSGKMRFVIDGKEFQAEAGDSWCIKGNVAHSAEVLEDSVAVEVFSPVRAEYLE